MTSLMLLWVILLLSPGQALSEKTPLYLGGFFAMTGDGWNGGLTTLPAVQFAVDLVNNRTDILPDHELVLVWNDTKGCATDSMKILFEFLNTPPKKVALIGPVLSKTAIPVAEAATGWNLLQMSFGPRTPELSCRSRFPYFYRTIGPDDVFNPAKVALLKHFRWTRVACLYESLQADIYYAATDDFIKRWKAHNYTIVATESVSNPGTSLDVLKTRDARIIIANMFFSKAKEVFCEAYKRGMYGSEYVWILPGWLPFNWWELNKPEVDCTVEQLKEAAEGIVMMDYTENTFVKKSAFGVESEVFEAHIRSQSSIYDQYARYAFDGMMAIALTLHKAAQEGVTLETFCYTNSTYVDTFVRIISNLEFEGLTGPITFNEKGNRIGITAITQNQDGVRQSVGKYNPFGEELLLEGDPEIHWCSSGKIPKDGFSRSELKRHLQNASFVAFMCIGVCGAVLCLLFLAFNYKNRELRSIKLSSPKMNNIILIGCILAYLGLIMNGLDSRFIKPNNFGIMCNVRVAVLSVSFTVAFGALFMKTWRVHQIMADKTLVRRKVVKDMHLMTFLLGLLGLDAVIFTAWFTYDPLERSVVSLGEKVDPNDSNHLITHLLETCTCKHAGYWIAALLVVKGLMLLYGLFLAWATRKISVDGLNDSRYIGMCVYNIALVCSVGVPAQFLMGVAYFDNIYIISSFSIVLCTTVTVCLVFVPKVYAVWKDPSGTVDFRTSSSIQKVAPMESLSHQIATLKKMETILAEKDKTIKKLESELDTAQKMTDSDGSMQTDA